MNACFKGSKALVPPLAFNPLIKEDDATGLTDFPTDSDFWKGNVQLDTNYTHHSGYGARCKVEIISKSEIFLENLDNQLEFRRTHICL